MKQDMIVILDLGSTENTSRRADSIAQCKGCHYQWRSQPCN